MVHKWPERRCSAGLPDTNLQNSRVAIARFEKNFKTKKVPKK